MTDLYGVPAPTATFSDIDEADAILVVDSNIICTHPVAALEVLRAHNSGSAKVFVVGHRSNKLTTQCSRFARTTPGSEPALLNCLADLLVRNSGLDGAALPQNLEDFDKFKLHAAKYEVSDTSAVVGIDDSIISGIAEGIAEAKNFLVVISPGSLHSAINSTIVRAAVNLAVLKGGKVLSLLREGNAQGALDMGVTPDFLPGYKEATGARGGSLEAVEILRAVGSGEIKVLYLMGGDIRREMSLLGLSLDALRSLDLLIVQDVFGGPVAEMAHVVLPACSFAERDGSYTNAFRMVQHAPEAIRPLGQSRPDAEILDELSHKLGLSAFDSLDAIRAQIAASVPIYNSIRETARGAETGPWDYSSVGATARQKLSIVKETSSTADEAHPYVLTFDNMLHYGGVSSLHSESLAKVRVDDVVEISEDDATSLGVESGTEVELKVKGGGSARLPVRVSRELPAGVVSVPSHSSDVIRNLIAKLDPSVFKAEGGVPVWFACINVSKD